MSVKKEPPEVDEGGTSTKKGEEISEKENDAETDAERPKQRRACLMLPEDDPAVFTFVAATAKQIGIKMGPQEELAPGVFYPAAQKLLVRVSHTRSQSLFFVLLDLAGVYRHFTQFCRLSNYAFHFETLSHLCRRARPCASLSSERATARPLSATGALPRVPAYRPQTSLKPSTRRKVNQFRS